MQLLLFQLKIDLPAPVAIACVTYTATWALNQNAKKAFIACSLYRRGQVRQCATSRTGDIWPIDRLGMRVQISYKSGLLAYGHTSLLGSFVHYSIRRINNVCETMKRYLNVVKTFDRYSRLLLYAALGGDLF
jgi:hypothetical protein